MKKQPGWLGKAVIWLFRPFSDSFRIFELVAILLAITAFIADLGNRREEREARAWNLLTTEAAGNSGKIWALEYLNHESHWPFFPKWWPLNKSRIPLLGIDLTPPYLASLWGDKPKEGRQLPEVDPPLSFRCGQETYLRKVNLRWGILTSAVLVCADLRQSDLRDVDLRQADLRNARLDDADLRDADFRQADLRNAILDDADLRGSNFRGTRIFLSDHSPTFPDDGILFLGGPELEGASFQKATLQGASFQEANLKRVNFQGADLAEANLRGANLQEAVFTPYKKKSSESEEVSEKVITNLRKADLRKATGVTCDQLVVAEDWQTTYRDEKLGCGEAIPTPPKASPAT